MQMSMALQIWGGNKKKMLPFPPELLEHDGVVLVDVHAPGGHDRKLLCAVSRHVGGQQRVDRVAVDGPGHHKPPMTGLE